MSAIYETIRVRFQESVCHLQLYRPDAQNTIDARMIAECTDVLDRCAEAATVIVLEGLPDVFCFGADFAAIQAGASAAADPAATHDPRPLYDLWARLATGPYVVVSHVRGKANAGGLGFVAASDIVLADDSATFALSELLFGLMPACVLPFLIRRIGFQRAHYMTLMTQPIDVTQALTAGLVDAHEANSAPLLRRHLSRLRRLSKPAVARYKRYSSALGASVMASRELAIKANQEVFSDRHNIENIVRYVEKGLFPWEAA